MVLFECLSMEKKRKRLGKETSPNPLSPAHSPLSLSPSRALSSPGPFPPSGLSLPLFSPRGPRPRPSFPLSPATPRALPLSLYLTAGPHRSAPFFFPLSPFLPGVQRPPKSPASFSSGPARRGLDPRPLTGPVAPTYLCRNPSRHRRPQRRLLLFFRRANTLGLPWAGCSAAPQATATPARHPPRRLELPQASN
jgi:hypothetical protein